MYYKTPNINQGLYRVTSIFWLSCAWGGAYIPGVGGDLYTEPLLCLEFSTPLICISRKGSGRIK